MKKATVFISTAALMAGTACGVYAETGDFITSSFDRGSYPSGKVHTIEYTQDYAQNHLPQDQDKRG